MEFRRLQQVGSRSYSVSLPKQWVLDNRLGKHSSVRVLVTGTNDVLIRCDSTTPKENTIIDVSVEEIEAVPEFIVFCYMKNVQQIRVRSKKFTYEQIRDIHYAVSHLEGLEITNETDTEIEVAFVFTEVNVTVQKIVRRLLHLMKLAVSALENNDPSGLSEIELSTDRLYYLATRVLFACRRNYRLREENCILNEDDLFFLGVILRKLENVADHLVRLGTVALNKHDLESLRFHTGILEQTLLETAPLRDVRKKLHAYTVDADERGEKRSLLRIHDLTRDVLENQLSLQFNKRFT